MRGACALWLLCAGCFAPRFANDEVVCKADGDCPPGYHCALVGSCFQKQAAPRRCPAAALLCDDFEGYALATWGAPFASVVDHELIAPPAGARVAVDQAQPFAGADPLPFHGLRSLHVVAPGTTQQPTPSIYANYLPYRLAVPVSTSGAATTLAVRAYLYAQAPFRDQPYFLYLHEQSGNGLNFGALHGDATHAASWTVFNRTSQRYAWDDPSHAIAPNRWYCVEVVVTLTNSFGADANSFDLYVDGASVAHGDLTNQDAIDRYDEVDAGNTWAQSAANNEYFLDDVVIANERIGCE